MYFDKNEILFQVSLTAKELGIIKLGWGKRQMDELNEGVRSEPSDGLEVKF